MYDIFKVFRFFIITKDNTIMVAEMGLRQNNFNTFRVLMMLKSNLISADIFLISVKFNKCF